MEGINCNITSIRYINSNSYIQIENTNFNLKTWMEGVNLKVKSHLDTMIQILALIQKLHFTLAYGWKDSNIELQVIAS